MHLVSDRVLHNIFVVAVQLHTVEKSCYKTVASYFKKTINNEGEFIYCQILCLQQIWLFIYCKLSFRQNVAVFSDAC